MFRKEYEAFFIPLVSALHTHDCSTHQPHYQEEHIMKRIVSIIIAIALILTASAAFAKTYKIGVGQFAQHGSLDNCYEGFM